MRDQVRPHGFHAPESFLLCFAALWPDSDCFVLDMCNSLLHAISCPPRTTSRRQLCKVRLGCGGWHSTLATGFYSCDWHSTLAAGILSLCVVLWRHVGAHQSERGVPPQNPSFDPKWMQKGRLRRDQANARLRQARSAFYCD